MSVCVCVCGASVRSSLWSVIGVIRNMVFHLIEAVHRYYVSRQRLFNDNQPQWKQKAEEVKRSSQKRNSAASAYTINHVMFSFIL